jgi:hypothetical protein
VAHLAHGEAAASIVAPVHPEASAEDHELEEVEAPLNRIAQYEEN